MGAKRNVDMSANTDVVKIVTPTTDAKSAQAEQTSSMQTAKTTTKKTRQIARRSKKYLAGRSQVDRTKTYDVFAAIELVKRLSYSKFDGTITADIVVKEPDTQVQLTFPHHTGKVIRVAIASDKLITDIAEGKIAFDILLSPPAFVAKLAKYARILGPKGLMPNPKNGTITNKPEVKKKELEAGMLTLKCEKKQPVMHVTIGKVSMETKDLVENTQALIDSLKSQAVRLTLSASMSPGVRVSL